MRYGFQATHTTLQVMSLKIWIVLCVLRELVKFVESQLARDASKAPRDLTMVYAK